MGFLGFPRFNLVLLGFIRVLLGNKWLYWVLPSFTEFYWFFTEFYWILPSFTGFYRV